MGQSPPSNTYNTYGEGLPFFQGKTEFNELYPTIKKWCSQPAKIVEKDAVLISVRAPVGPTNIAPDRCCIGRGLAGLMPYPGVSNRFVLYGIHFEIISYEKST
jgi:type I restriction enzyme S subunit